MKITRWSKPYWTKFEYRRAVRQTPCRALKVGNEDVLIPALQLTVLDLRDWRTNRFGRARAYWFGMN